jgi:hypothetical protein
VRASAAANTMLPARLPKAIFILKITPVAKTCCSASYPLCIPRATGKMLA